METENVRDEIEIDIRGLIMAILNKFVIIMIIAVIAAGVAYGYSRYFVTPKYMSTTKLYIFSKQDPEQKIMTTSDLAFATYLANDYCALIKSEPVLQEVSEQLGLKTTVAELSSMIDVEVEEETRVMEVSVVSTSPKLSKKIADKVVEVVNDKTREVMDGIEAVKTIGEAKVPTAPCSPNVRRNTLLGFILGFGLAAAFVGIRFILDDSIKTSDDIEKWLGVSVLASIPLRNDDKKSKKEKEIKKIRKGDKINVKY